MINKTYQYFNDGALSYSHDLIDQLFDRAYVYDTTTAQVRQALSGAEARNQGTTNDRPYKETFDYKRLGLPAYLKILLLMLKPLERKWS